MPAHDLELASTTEGLPVAPSLGPTLEATGTGGLAPPNVSRVVYLSGLAIAWWAVRVFGGITGDVLGAAVETGCAVALLVTALTS